MFSRVIRYYQSIFDFLQVDAYLDKLRAKYEELAKAKLESTLRKRAPPGRVPLAEIDFFTEFMYIDCDDLNNMSVTQI